MCKHIVTHDVMVLNATVALRVVAACTNWVL